MQGHRAQLDQGAGNKTVVILGGGLVGWFCLFGDCLFGFLFLWFPDLFLVCWVFGVFLGGWWVLEVLFSFAWVWFCMNFFLVFIYPCRSILQCFYSVQLPVTCWQI